MICHLIMYTHTHTHTHTWIHTYKATIELTFEMICQVQLNHDLPPAMDSADLGISPLKLAPHVSAAAKIVPCLGSWALMLPISIPGQIVRGCVHFTMPLACLPLFLSRCAFSHKHITGQGKCQGLFLPGTLSEFSC